jgi:hypothetical protein
MIEQIDAALTVAYQRGDELGLGPFALGVVRLNEISSSALLHLEKEHTWVNLFQPDSYMVVMAAKSLAKIAYLHQSLRCLPSKKEPTWWKETKNCDQSQPVPLEPAFQQLTRFTSSGTCSSAAS